ncbi:MAG: hypothetical protein K9N23_03090 [Akkermansiaceae bacterium]|nr:hypothetical protein [Akkermansiaceae bacterium]MCF7730640.1 hypothetical protein [Akkermansiaceae bacterium]
MTVVTDTSAILNLCLLGLEDVLPTLFGETHAPGAVLDEFVRLTKVDPRFTGLVFPDFIAIHNVTRIHPSLATHLSPYLDRLQTEARFWFTKTLRLQVLRLGGGTTVQSHSQ